MICEPIRCTGFSEVIGSWKIIAISAPRTRRSSSSSAPISSVPLYVAVPSKRALGEQHSPINVIAVTGRPEPDSPTTASTSARGEFEGDAVDGLHDALLGRERDAQVLDLEQRIAHYWSRIRGSRYAYMMSTIAFSNTMKNAENIVTANTGGTSSWPIASAAYCPPPAGRRRSR